MYKNFYLILSFLFFLLLAIIPLIVIYFRGWMIDIRRSLRLIENRMVSASSHRDLLWGLSEDLQYIEKRLSFSQGIPRTRQWAASPDFLRCLADMILDCKPLRVVECGSGLTSLIIAKALEVNGRGELFSFENDITYQKTTKDLLEYSEVSQRVKFSKLGLSDFIKGGSEYQWYDLETSPEEKIDLLVVDGPPCGLGPRARYPALPVLASSLNPGSLILLDDYNRDDEKEVVEAWLKEFPVKILRTYPFEKGAVLLVFEEKMARRDV